MQKRRRYRTKRRIKEKKQRLAILVIFVFFASTISLVGYNFKTGVFSLSSMARLGASTAGSSLEYIKTEDITDEFKDDEYQRNYQETTLDDGSYIKKSAEWVDKENGEALITLKASPKSDEETIALYVATMCYAHGLTEDIVVDNILTLLENYDYVDFIAIIGWYEDGIADTKRFTKDNTKEEITEYVSAVKNPNLLYPHYINSIPAAIEKYLFGGLGDDYISEESMINEPTAIYISCDSMILSNTYRTDVTYTSISDSNVYLRIDHDTWGIEYATEKYFTFMKEKYLGRYFSMSFSSQQEDEPQLSIRWPTMSVYDSNQMNIMIGILNLENYGEADNVLSEETLEAWENNTLKITFVSCTASSGGCNFGNATYTDKKYAAQYNYSETFAEADVKMVGEFELTDTIEDYYKIKSVEITGGSSDLSYSIDDNKITVTDPNYECGSEITVKIYIKLKTNITTTFETFKDTNEGNANLSYSTVWVNVESPKLLPNTSSYTVNYINKETKEKITDSKTVTGVAINTQISASDEVIEIDGYEYDSVDSKKITVGKDENIINIYYLQKAKVKVKYIDINTKEEISDSTIIDGYVGEDYKTQAKEIKGYTLVKEAENEKGTMGEEEIEVVYYYAKEAQVIVKYIDPDTKEEISESTTIDGYVGEDYKTQAKDITGYTLINQSGNSEGTMKEDTIVVIYYYSKSDANIVKTGDYILLAVFIILVVLAVNVLVIVRRNKRK